jgi:hypothetical protein
MDKNGYLATIEYKTAKNGQKMDIAPMREIKNITITPEILKPVADMDEFKGRRGVPRDPGAGKADQPPAYLHPAAAPS